MNLSVYIGDQMLSKKPEYLDFEKDAVRFMVLVGSTSTGKSIFHNNLYKQLSENNSPEEVGFIFLDMTRVDFTFWGSPYTLQIEVSAIGAIELLEKMADEPQQRDKKIFIHIEECNMFANYTIRAEAAVTTLLNRRKDVIIIYSTSRPSPNDAFRKELRDLADVRVISHLPTQRDYKYVMSKHFKFKKQIDKYFNEHFISWGRLVIIHDKMMALDYFCEELAGTLKEFELGQSLSE